MIIYRFIKHLYLNLKYASLLSKIYKDEKLLDNLSELFNVKFKKDWIGRVYAIFNPSTMDVNNQIFEYNETGLSNEVYIEKQIMDKLNIASKFIQTNNLFDLLTYKIEKIDKYNNYLFVMQPITLEDCLNSTKKFIILYSILTVIGITMLTII